MGFFDSVWTSQERGVTLTNKEAFSIFGVNSSEIKVNPHTAMQHTTVYACVNVKAQGISSVPFDLYKKTNNGREKATKHPLFRILHNQVNPFMTSTVWREMVVKDLELRGTHYSQIVRDNAGRVKALYPLVFDNMDIDITVSNKNVPTIKYYYTIKDNGKVRTFNQDQVLRIVGLPSADGLTGITPITQNALSLRLGISAETFGEKFFSNGANGSGILSTEQILKDESAERLKKQFGEKYAGISNSKKPIVLEQGMKWQPLTISNNDSQFLETRQFQKAEIASIFRVSPHLINDLSKATFSNITELSQEHVKYCLMPLGVKVESSINTQLLSEKEQEEYYCELNYDGLLRGNFKERSEGYKEAINAGWMKPNEARVKENLPVDSTGDKLLMQMQYTTLEEIEKGQKDETNSD